MKKLLLTLGSCALALGAFAQNIPANAIRLVEGSQKNYPAINFWDNGVSNETVDNIPCIQVSNTTENPKNKQISLESNYQFGITYFVSFKVKSNLEQTGLTAAFQNGESKWFGSLSNFDVTTEWQYVTISGSPSPDSSAPESLCTRIYINSGTTISDIYYADFVVYYIPSADQKEIEIASYYTGNGKTFGGWGGGTFSDGTEDTYPCLKFTNDVAKAESYNIQAGLQNLSLTSGTTYFVKFKVKGTPFNDISSEFQNSDSYAGKGNLTKFNITEEWQEVIINGIPTFTEDSPADRIVINLGKYVGTFYMTDVTIYYMIDDGSDDGSQDQFVAPEGYVTIISGDTADGSDIVTWESEFKNGEEDGKQCIIFTNEAAAANTYDLQLAIDYDYEPGTMYYITFEVKGNVSDVAISTWYQNKAKYAALGYNDFNTFTVNSDSEWTQVVLQGQYAENDDMTADRVAINLGAYVGTLYMTNFNVYGPKNDEPVIPSNTPVQIPTDAVVIAQGDQANGNVFISLNCTNGTVEVDNDDIECVTYTGTEKLDSWSKQFGVDLNYETGKTYYLQFDVMGDPCANPIGAWFQYVDNTAGIYETVSYLSNQIYVTQKDAWETVTLYGTVSPEATSEYTTANRIVINLGGYVGTMYMTNFKVYGPDTSDSINSIRNIDGVAPVFNLQGVKVGNSDNLNNLSRGIYIINGKKVVIR